MTYYSLLAGGPPSQWPEQLFSRHKDDFWIGVDRGTYHLHQKGLAPVRAFGDFDSISEEERRWLNEQNTELDVFPDKKDQTDLEIALDWVLEQEPDGVYLFGATGGRLDHCLMNIQLLIKGARNGIPVFMVDNHNKITMLKPGEYRIKHDSWFPYHSFIAHSEKVSGITLKEFKYPLNKATLEWGSSLCISNELNGESAKLSFDSGWLLHIQSKD